MFNWGLWGILTVQVCKFYYSLYLTPFRSFKFGNVRYLPPFFQRLLARSHPRQVLRFLGRRLTDISPVFTLYFLECVQTALSSADIFHWFSRGWGQLRFLSDPYVAPIDLPVMAGLIAMIVQLYFTWRIWVLSTSVPLCALIGATSVAQCIAGIISGIQVRRQLLLAFGIFYFNDWGLLTRLLILGI